MNKAIFLDKDGTLLVNVPFNVDPALMVLHKNIIDGLKIFQEHDYLLIVVTNQSGVARGYFREVEVLNVKIRLEKLLEEAGVYLDGFYYCPHHPDGIIKEYAITCDCRKPAPGMLLKAASEFRIDLTRSWMIGDILNDVESGNRVACKTILIDNKNETEWNLNEKRTPDIVAANIDEAAELLLMNGILEPPASYTHLAGKPGDTRR